MTSLLPGEQRACLAVGKLTQPTVAGIAFHFGFDLFLNRLVEGEADMGDNDARFLRQVAHGHRRTQRILFIAQMADHANFKPIFMALRYARQVSQPTDRSL